MQLAVGNILCRSSRAMRAGSSGSTACAPICLGRPCRLPYGLQSTAYSPEGRGEARRKSNEDAYSLPLPDRPERLRCAP